MAKHSEELGIHSILGGIGAHPANRSLHVVELGWPAIHGIFGIEKAIVGGNCDEAGLGKEFSQLAHRALVETGPSATVQQQNRRTSLRIAVGRLKDVEMQLRPVNRGVNNVFVDGDAIRLRRVRSLLLRSRVSLLRRKGES